MAGKRAASGGRGDDDSDYDSEQERVQQRSRKAPKKQQKDPAHNVVVRKASSRSSSSSGSKAAPSRVTPEQIIAHAVAVRKKNRSAQQQPLKTERTSSSAYAEVYEEKLVVKEEREAAEHRSGNRKRRAAEANDEQEEALSEEVEEDEYDEDGLEEEEEEIAAPVVFQCGTCRSIFGDSYSFVGSNADLLLVTLSAVTNITTTKEPQTSKEGMDMGSSFQELLCSQCQTVLGRKYLTTPILLDAIRGLYSFATTTIASYQLGYPQLQSLHADKQSDSTAGATISVGASFEDMKRATIACDQAVKALSGDRQELLKLREDMTKVQNLLLVVDERLHQLEETEEPDSEAELDEKLLVKRRR